MCDSHIYCCSSSIKQSSTQTLSLRASSDSAAGAHWVQASHIKGEPMIWRSNAVCSTHLLSKAKQRQDKGKQQAAASKTPTDNGRMMEEGRGEGKINKNPVRNLLKYTEYWVQNIFNISKRGANIWFLSCSVCWSISWRQVSALITGGSRQAGRAAIRWLTSLCLQRI